STRTSRLQPALTRLGQRRGWRASARASRCDGPRGPRPGASSAAWRCRARRGSGVPAGEVESAGFSEHELGEAPSVDEMVTTTLLGEAIAASEAAALLFEDEDLECVAANEAACMLTGYTHTELLVLRVPDLLVVPENTVHQAARNVTSGTILPGHTTVRTKDGATVRVWYLSVPTRVEGPTNYVLTICGPLTTQAERVRRRAAEWRDDAQALRAQAGQALKRSRRRLPG